MGINKIYNKFNKVKKGEIGQQTAQKALDEVEKRVIAKMRDSNK